MLAIARLSFTLHLLVVICSLFGSSATMLCSTTPPRSPEAGDRCSSIVAGMTLEWPWSDGFNHAFGADAVFCEDVDLQSDHTGGRGVGHRPENPRTAPGATRCDEKIVSTAAGEAAPLHFDLFSSLPADAAGMEAAAKFDRIGDWVQSIADRVERLEEMKPGRTTQRRHLVKGRLVGGVVTEGVVVEGVVVERLLIVAASSSCICPVCQLACRDRHLMRSLSQKRHVVALVHPLCPVIPRATSSRLDLVGTRPLAHWWLEKRAL